MSEPRIDPREDADLAYAAFMSMGTDEWKGAFRSVTSGGGAFTEVSASTDLSGCSWAALVIGW